MRTNDGPTPRELVGAALIGFGYSPDYANALMDKFLAHERSAGAAPLDVERLTEITAILTTCRHILAPQGYSGVAQRIDRAIARLSEGTDR